MRISAIVACARKPSGIFLRRWSAHQSQSFRGHEASHRAFRHRRVWNEGFARICGTPLFYYAVHSTDIGIMIGAFDQPAGIKPISQDSIESRVPWFKEIVDVPDSGTSESLDGPDRVAAVAASNRQHPDHDTEKWPR